MDDDIEKHGATTATAAKRNRMPLRTGMLTAAASVLLAALIIGLTLVPARFWHHPSVDAIYRGFDPNLVYASATGPGNAPGVITITPSSVAIAAVPGSYPTVHLLTTPLGFSASFDVKIVAAPPNSEPLRVGIWSPATRSGFYLIFEPDPGDLIRVETVVNGTVGQDLVGGTVSTTQVLGQYLTGEEYRVSLALDRNRQTIKTEVTNTSPPFGTHAIQLRSAPNLVTQVIGSPIKVTPGRRYSFGGWVEPVVAVGTYAIGVFWLDSNGKSVPSNTDVWWRSPDAGDGWARELRDAVAPSGAASAQIFLGAAAKTSYMFGGIFFHDSSNPGSNLVRNGSFDAGLEGWATVGAAPPASLANLMPIEPRFTLTADQAPELFAAFRPTLTFSSSSQESLAQSVVGNYVVTIPSQPASGAEEAEKIDDPVARAAILILLSAAILLLITAGIRWAHARVLNRRPGVASSRTRLRIVLSPSTILLFGAAVLLYYVANALLFRVGSPLFDVFAAKVWSYVALRDGVADLYYRPLLVSAAAVSSGVPWHESVFPYGITSAYYFLTAGWIFDLVSSPNGPLNIDTYSMEVLLKSLNVAFAVADAALLYLILKPLVNRRAAVGAVALLILNPALIFVMSVWGSTETISIFFILGSIWLAEAKKPVGAWAMLAAAAFTRPQMLVLAFLLGLIYLRTFGTRRSIVPIAWTVIGFFVFLGPFALSISPSFPIDYVFRTATYHFANGQADPSYLGLSPGYFSVWTLPMLWVSGQHGLSRMWSPSTLDIYGSLSYGQLAATLSVGFVLLTGALLVLSRRLVTRPGQYFPVLAFGMMGWLMFTPGLISRYFVYAIVLVILCRRVFSMSTYIAVVGGLTVIAFITSFGHLALDFLGNGATAVVLNPVNNDVSHFIFTLFSDDRVITVGTFANILILITLGVKVVEGLTDRSSSGSEVRAIASTMPVGTEG